MRVEHEIREDRNDVYSFWKMVKTIDEDTEVITRTDTMIEETTIDAINKKILDLKAQRIDLAKKINKEEGKLILFAEMKLPGEAWLEFKIINNTLYQSATFRPRGIWGKLYWYSVLPFHGFIFNGMLKKLIH